MLASLYRVGALHCGAVGAGGAARAGGLHFITFAGAEQRSRMAEKKLGDGETASFSCCWQHKLSAKAAMQAVHPNFKICCDCHVLYCISTSVLTVAARVAMLARVSI